MGTYISVYPFSKVCLSNINNANARSSFANIPLSTTKREPDNFVATLKSINPNFSPISK